MKLIVLDATSGICHIYTVTKEMCESEDNIVDFLMEKEFNLVNIQYMYGNVKVVGDVEFWKEAGLL